MGSVFVRSSSLARLLSAVLAGLLLVGGAVLAAAVPASAGASYFVSRINEERAEAGRKALKSNSTLAAIAVSHSQKMAASGDLYHNPKLTSVVPNYRLVAENVGYGPNEPTVHAAFMNSAGHRANILDSRLTEVGVGVVVDAKGRVWVTEVFRTPTSSTSGSTSGSTTTTKKATAKPTPKPTKKPAAKPSAKPTPKPTRKAVAVAAPTPRPTPKPTPTATPTPQPTPTPAALLRAEAWDATAPGIPVATSAADGPAQGRSEDRPNAIAILIAFGAAGLAGLGLRIPLG
jgi:hypothetical protein